MGMMPSKPRVAASSTNSCSYAEAVFTIVFYAYKSIGVQFFRAAIGRQTSTGQCVNVEIGRSIHWVTHSTVNPPGVRAEDTLLDNFVRPCASVAQLAGNPRGKI